MLIAGVFLTLFSGWALWGWAVGESKNIRVLRQICGPIFVVTATTIVAGGTILVTRATVKRQAEQNVRELLTGIHDRLQNGDAELVKRQLQALIVVDPDEDPKDLMASLPAVSSTLAVDKANVIIATDVQQFDEPRRH